LRTAKTRPLFVARELPAVTDLGIRRDSYGVLGPHVGDQ
jgi:hypothetical protein